MNKIATVIRPAVLDGVSIVDADTHITEVHDLWTSRAPARFKDRVPQVKIRNGVPEWVIDGDKTLCTGCPASAIRRDGSKVGVEFFDMKFDEAHPSSYDIKERLRYMDAAGITAQIAYPNVLGFGGHRLAVVDPELSLLTAQIFNDAMAELQAVSGNRIFPMAMTPWWDIKESVAEAKRCHKMGLRGMNTNSDPQTNGLPDLPNQHWYPFWEVCQDLELPINFHVGSSDISMSWFGTGVWPAIDTEAKKLAFGTNMLFIGNSRVLTNIILSGFLDNFPRLKIVSVESGIGWIPFLLESLEYQMQENWITCKTSPLEVFQRQIYACSWFEKRNFVAHVRMLGADTVMFETDYPHPTCLYPDALNYIATAAAEFTPDERRKVFGGNAAKLYKIPVT